MADPQTMTAVLEQVRSGADGATDRLFRLVFEELRVMARARMAGERKGHTLQTTALVNEAYLKLCGGRSDWENRRHFFGAAARAMRQILVDRARQKAAQKRIEGGERVSLDPGMATDEQSVDLIALDEALDRLAEVHARPAEVVKYRYFLGLTVPETAELLEVAPRTVDGDWKLARAWLMRELSR
ncbi:hypothetical protein ABI59_20760 [Acidobacteria bacterium Mor1]|nr:hypothetical protein ABI59_20760 [Acidobacteria bacterium Mor1]